MQFIENVERYFSRRVIALVASYFPAVCIKEKKTDCGWSSQGGILQALHRLNQAGPKSLVLFKFLTLRQAQKTAYRRANAGMLRRMAAPRAIKIC